MILVAAVSGSRRAQAQHLLLGSKRLRSSAAAGRRRARLPRRLPSGRFVEQRFRSGEGGPSRAV